MPKSIKTFSSTHEGAQSPKAKLNHENLQRKGLGGGNRHQRLWRLTSKWERNEQKQFQNPAPLTGCGALAGDQNSTPGVGWGDQPVPVFLGGCSHLCKCRVCSLKDTLSDTLAPSAFVALTQHARIARHLVFREGTPMESKPQFLQNKKCRLWPFRYSDTVVRCWHLNKTTHL